MKTSFAPENDKKFRVIGIDTFDGTDWVIEDVDDVAKATVLAQKKACTMLKTYIYNEKDIHIFDAGILL